MCGQLRDTMKCAFVSLQKINALNFKCNLCDFETFSECTIERHDRDIHNCFTQSISPQPKKRKHKEKDYEEMEAMNFKETVFKDNDLTKDDEVFWIDARNVNDKENDILLERSRIQDEKIKKKEQKRKEEERSYIEENERMKKEKEKKEIERKERDKLEKSFC